MTGKCNLGKLKSVLAYLLLAFIGNYASAQPRVVDGELTAEFPEASGFVLYEFVAPDRVVPFTIRDLVINDGGPEPLVRPLFGKVTWSERDAIRARLNSASAERVHRALPVLRSFGELAITELDMIPGEAKVQLLKELAFHKRLRAIDLFCSEELDTEAGRLALLQLNSLEYLKVRSHKGTYSREFIQTLTKMKRLRGIHIYSDDMNDDFITQILGIEKIESLELICQRSLVSAGGLKQLGTLKYLQQLRVCCDAEIRAADLEPLVKNPSVFSVSVLTNSPHVNDSIVPALEALSDHCKVQTRKLPIKPVPPR